MPFSLCAVHSVVLVDQLQSTCGLGNGRCRVMPTTPVYCYCMTVRSTPRLQTLRMVDKNLVPSPQDPSLALLQQLHPSASPIISWLLIRWATRLNHTAEFWYIPGRFCCKVLYVLLLTWRKENKLLVLCGVSNFLKMSTLDWIKFHNSNVEFFSKSFRFKGYLKKKMCFRRGRNPITVIINCCNFILCTTITFWFLDI
jgi:hypothetical protein